MRLRAGCSNEGKESTLIGSDIISISEFAVYIPQLALAVISLVCGVGAL